LIGRSLQKQRTYEEPGDPEKRVSNTTKGIAVQQISRSATQTARMMITIDAPENDNCVKVRLECLRYYHQCLRYTVESECGCNL
jgi:hypothetical protein